MKVGLYGVVLIGAFLLLLVIALLSFTSDYQMHKGSIGDVCFSSICIETFSNNFSGTLKVLKEGTTIIALSAAIFGSMIALNNYRASLRSSALSGHINHLKLFQDYVETESQKIGIEGKKSIDTFCWYRKMFPNSKSGNVSVPKTYKDLVVQLVSEIKKSSVSVSIPNSDYSFTPNDHQRRMISSLGNIGISVARNAPDDFYETEGKILRLIESVNLTFSDSDVPNSGIPTLMIERPYI